MLCRSVSARQHTATQDEQDEHDNNCCVTTVKLARRDWTLPNVQFCGRKTKRSIGLTTGETTGSSSFYLQTLTGEILKTEIRVLRANILKDSNTAQHTCSNPAAEKLTKMYVGNVSSLVVFSSQPSQPEGNTEYCTKNMAPSHFPGTSPIYSFSCNNILMQDVHPSGEHSVKSQSKWSPYMKLKHQSCT